MTPTSADDRPAPPLIRTDCPMCGQHRISAAHLANDPHRWARAEAERLAAHWLGTHPCERTRL